MEMKDDHVEMDEHEASNKPHKPHNVRIVLAVSLLLTIIALSVIWIIPALS